ncbi:hypothetical protein C8R46DRAFT_1038728 [Mycena filopes]|nr:hypothetical protein C8R46DRAFT_1038728 [Mycena filopes]
MTGQNPRLPFDLHHILWARCPRYSLSSCHFSIQSRLRVHYIPSPRMHGSPFRCRGQPPDSRYPSLNSTIGPLLIASAATPADLTTRKYKKKLKTLKTSKSHKDLKISTTSRLGKRIARSGHQLEQPNLDHPSTTLRPQQPFTQHPRLTTRQTFEHSLTTLLPETWHQKLRKSPRRNSRRDVGREAVWTMWWEVPWTEIHSSKLRRKPLKPLELTRASQNLSKAPKAQRSSFTRTNCRAYHVEHSSLLSGKGI